MSKLSLLILVLAAVNTFQDVQEEEERFTIVSSNDEGSYGYDKNITGKSLSRRKRAAGDAVSTSGEQYCILFNDISGITGAQKLITDYVPDLEELGWKDVVSSMKCYGLWIFYQAKNFDPTGNSNVFWLSRTNPDHFKLEGSYADHNDKMVSLRYAGAIEDPFLVDSITLYEHHWYGGEEYFTLEDIPFIPSRMNDKVSSVVVTGKADWTIYEDKEFSGKSHCLRQGSDGKKFYNQIGDIQMNDIVTSVKKGC